MACPERAARECDSVNPDVPGIQNLKQGRSEELARSSAASLRLVHVVGIQCGKALLAVKDLLCRTAAVLPGQDMFPPFLSVSVKDTGAFHNDILGSGYEETRLHGPAVDAFPSCPDRWIAVEIIGEVKHRTFFEYQMGV